MQRRIVPIGDPALRKPARPTGSYERDLAELAVDMVETMRSHDGVGLAAPQLAEDVAMTVIEVPDPGSPDSEDMVLYVLCDPIIEHLAEFEPMREGCLSLPGYIAYPRRARRARVRATTLDGQQQLIEADGLLAQALQHEIDHLHGILFTDLVDSLWELEADDQVTRRMSEVS